MPLINVIAMLIVAGLVLWLVKFLPLDATIQRIIHAVVIVVVILWLLTLFFPGIGAMRVGG
jgi:hypothetical protein